MTTRGLGASIQLVDSMAAGLELSRFIEAGDLRRAGQWLIERYARDVVAICRAMVRERHLAEDLAQDAFSNALSSLSSFRREASPRTWLLAIARNRCIDHFRKLARDPWGGADDDDHEPDAHADDGPLPADVVLRRADVEAALAPLAEAERALIVLRFRHGLEYPELASVFGLREATLRMRLSRALAKMRSELERIDQLTLGAAAEPVIERARALPAPARSSAARVPPPAPGAAPLPPPRAPAPAAAAPPPAPAAAAPPPPAAFGGAPPPERVRARAGWWQRLLGWLGISADESPAPSDDEVSPELRARLQALVAHLPGSR